MKYFAAAIVAFAAASAAASPATAGKRDTEKCVFGTYSCTPDNSGIEICDIEGNWELVGPCPSGESCQDLPQNGFDLPFCTNNPPAGSKAKRGGAGWCPTPGQYTCDGYNAIQVCNTTYGLEKVGNCPYNSHCAYINNIPYCVD